MKKLARAIVKMRRLILIAAVLLLIPAAVGAIATPINYDILSYLPQELDSRVGQLLLETDYHLASTNMITVEGMPTNELLAMKAEIDEVPDVLNTFWLSDVLDPAVPTEMLPAAVQSCPLTTMSCASFATALVSSRKKAIVITTMAAITLQGASIGYTTPSWQNIKAILPALIVGKMGF